MNSAQHQVLEMAVGFYGPRHQVDLACEECGELLVAIGHYRRGRCDLDAVAGEAADVSVILWQLAYIFGASHVDKARDAFPVGPVGEAMDEANSACAKLVAELMAERSGTSAPLLVCIAIGRAWNAVDYLARALDFVADVALIRSEKISRLHGRMATALEAGRG